MKIGCGFIVLCIVGLLGISMLYYSIVPYMQDEDKDSDYINTTAYVVETLQFRDEQDSSYWYVIPILEYSVDGQIIVDTAYHERMRDRYYDNNDTTQALLPNNTALNIQVNRDDLYDYSIVYENTFMFHLKNELSAYRIGFIIVGSIFLLIFLRGLSKTFAYKEPPPDQRLR
ncbi:hypothetical protein E1176_02065 [Fulvivirga sp. RKSG066]|uniref:hypothetical protein n=1 Tax=Fulvivirga aurantia TaxID=2529383 RepID=UPI0012BD571E|nr:hypothetical protein [Fulvivirga aurantia]MTI19798.1 hypothetical protein [Fulvivirga aurantia]